MTLHTLVKKWDNCSTILQVLHAVLALQYENAIKVVGDGQKSICSKMLHTLEKSKFTSGSLGAVKVESVHNVKMHFFSCDCCCKALHCYEICPSVDACATTRRMNLLPKFAHMKVLSLWFTRTNSWWSTSPSTYNSGPKRTIPLKRRFRQIYTFSAHSAI